MTSLITWLSWPTTSMNDFFYTDELKTIITTYLGAESFEDVKHNPNKFFGTDKEEFWSIDLPDGVHVLLELVVSSKRHAFTWGLIRLCEYDNRKCVIEESASPITLHYLP